jgi:hypothetical protein
LGLNLDRAIPTEQFPGQRIEFEIAETQPPVTTDVHPDIPDLQ